MPNVVSVDIDQQVARRALAACSNATGITLVEDGCVDDEQLRMEHWPRGVLLALGDWLASPAGSEFSVRRDLELHGVTCHPSGFLQRAGGA